MKSIYVLLLSNLMALQTSCGSFSKSLRTKGATGSSSVPAQVTKLKNQVIDLRAEKEQQLSQQKSLFNQLASEHQTLLEEKTTLEAEKNNVQILLDNAETEKQDLTSEKTAAEKEKEEISVSLDTHKQMLESANEEKVALQTSLDKEVANKLKLENDLIDLEADAAADKAQVLELTEELDISKAKAVK